MKPDTSAPDMGQKEALRLHAVPTGQGDAIHTLFDLPQFGRWARTSGFTDANLKSAWRTGTVEGYPGRIATATFKDGLLTISGDVDQPSDATRIGLQDEYKEAQPRFPKPVTLAAVGSPPPGCDMYDENTFIYHGPRGEIEMIHQRYETDDGGKGFIPWTFWSDGQWRKIEPEVMPFYGVPGMENAATLVLHEGAKAARRMHEIVANKAEDSRLPWYDELRHAHHVGWIGGVNAVSRSDWSILTRRAWNRVIIVADNDKKGLRAARRIARHFSANVFILTFDQRFDEGFDLADEWPDGLFNERSHYTGPTLRDCLIPATQATVMVPSQRRGGPPTAVLRSEFAATVACTIEPLRFVMLHNPSQDYSADEFNALVAPFSDVKDTATKVYGEVECQHHRMIWDPSEQPGSLNRDGLRCLNVYDPPKLIAKRGDVTPWLELLEHLFIEEADRAHVIRFLATLYAQPKTRMRWAILLISEQTGVGKGTIGEVSKMLLGRKNISFPSNKDISESQFNSWAVRKRLAFVPELYSGHSKKAANDLKAKITDATLPINEKFIKGHEVDNWLHIIACSNSKNAIHIDNKDRRWFIPQIAEVKRDPEKWKQFYDWLEDNGASHILQWARDQVSAGNCVRTNEEAPQSTRKREIAKSMQSEGAKLAAELAEHVRDLDQHVILRTDHIREWVAIKRGFKRNNGEADTSHRFLETIDTIVKAIKSVPGITVWADKLRPKFGMDRPSVIMNFVPEEGARWSDIKDRLSTIEEIGLAEPF